MTERVRVRIKHDPDRIKQVNPEIEEQDCCVVSQNTRLGRYDCAPLIETPNYAHMSQHAVILDARGTIETETPSAEPTELFIEVMKGQ